MVSPSSFAAAGSSISRSVYLSRIRRAFLLRVHPDRFRNQNDRVRSKQASLVKALADRLSQPDFSAWQQGIRRPSPTGTNNPLYGLMFDNDSNNAKSSSNKGDHVYPFILEKRDGSFVETSMKLSSCASVESILNSMTEALQSVGAKSLPSPPTDDQINGQHIQYGTSSSSSEGFHASDKDDGVDHRFDIMSQRGRDLLSFLSTLNENDIRDRKASRVDAQAAALEVRRLYHFQAVDATTLGWSSASVAILLQKLIALHIEHEAKLNVSSFYPSRLLFTPDDFHSDLDVYGGVVRLNPSSTPLQWLETLQRVTPETIQLIKFYRTSLAEKSKLAQSVLGVKIKRGHSCSSREYYEFVDRFCPKTKSDNIDALSAGEVRALVVSNYETDENGVALEPATLTVESSQHCGRRPIVTKEGTIRLGTALLESQVRQAISKLTSDARKQARVHAEEKERCKQAIEQMQWQLGLERVYRATVGVNNTQFLECLARILKSQEEQQHRLKVGLTGNSLGIACTGHFCHLADDGSVVIPYDWS